MLGREKFRKYLHEDEAKRFLAALVRGARWVEVNVEITACRDASDNKFLELAVNGGATHIISAEKDLLSLNPFRGIPVLSPAISFKRFDRPHPRISGTSLSVQTVVTIVEGVRPPGGFRFSNLALRFFGGQRGGASSRLCGEGLG